MFVYFSIKSRPIFFFLVFNVHAFAFCLVYFLSLQKIAAHVFHIMKVYSCRNLSKRIFIIFAQNYEILDDILYKWLGFKWPAKNLDNYFFSLGLLIRLHPYFSRRTHIKLGLRCLGDAINTFFRKSIYHLMECAENRALFDCKFEIVRIGRFWRFKR